MSSEFHFTPYPISDHSLELSDSIASAWLLVLIIQAISAIHSILFPLSNYSTEMRDDISLIVYFTCSNLSVYFSDSISFNSRLSSHPIDLNDFNSMFLCIIRFANYSLRLIN